MKNKATSSLPSSSWRFEDWCIAVNAPTANILDVAHHLDLKNDGNNTNSKGGDFAESTINRWRKHSISDRENAKKMLIVLSEIAHRNKIPILTGQYFREHARIFLTSANCCKEKYAPLDEEELIEILRILRRDEKPPLIENYYELIERVLPRPPQRDSFYGRDEDLNEVMRAMESSTITIIDSVGGNGKTALAWYASLTACESGLVRQFDWTTDKRSIFNLEGYSIPVENEPLNFNRILRSMAVRFNWHDVMPADDNDLECLCSNKLTTNFYLIVVDNLETIEQYEEVVEKLTKLLYPQKSRAVQTSRALITSRAHVRKPHCKRIELTGLELEPTIKYIRRIEEGLSNQTTPKLSEQQCRKIWEITQGNPMFIQIAMANYTKRPSQFTAMINDIHTDTNFDEAFTFTIGELFDNLPSEAKWLAITAMDLTLSRLDITYDSLLDIWKSATSPEDIAYFDPTFTILIKNHILKPTSNGYSIHSLVQKFLYKYKIAHNL